MNDEKLQYLFRRKHERPGDVFMEILEREGLIVCASVYHAMGAKVARLVRENRSTQGLPSEYNAVYHGGYAVSGMLLGLPDNGFPELYQLVSLLIKFVVFQSYPMPVILDAETGFGNAVTLTRTVETFHSAGVAVAHLEDQVNDDPFGSTTRRCGNQGGKKCISIEAMEAKIRSWLSVSNTIETSMRLLVRTDALTAVGGGIEEVIERGKRYLSVEAGGLRPIGFWVDALMKPDDINRLKIEMHRFDPNVILCMNNSPNKDWPDFYRKNYNCEPPSYQELYDGGSGFRIIHHTIMQMRADTEADWLTFDDQASNGNRALYDLQDRQRGKPYANAHLMTDTHLYQEYEQYIGGEAAKERFEQSRGFGGGELV